MNNEDNYQQLLEADIALMINLGKYDSTDAYMLVEGATDKEFIGKLDVKLKKESNTRPIRCISIGSFLNSNKCLKNKFGQPFNRQDDQNSKEFILHYIKEKSKECFYGLVDKDFTSHKSNDITNVFVTPTHDLETLLLKTDKTIFKKPEDITEFLKDALYLSYLIGIIKKYMQNKKYVLRKSYDLKKIINKQKKEINLKELIDFLIDENKNKLSQGEKLKLEREIVREGILSVDDDGIIDIDSDEVIFYKDLYDITDGHDVLSIMKLLCETQVNQFIGSNNIKGHVDLDREVEFAIINKYDLKSFSKCQLFKDMIGKKFIFAAKELTTAL